MKLWLSHVQNLLEEVIMNDSESTISIKEHLSAVLDDEAGSFEQRRVLDELKSDEVLSKKLASYALIGETMRAGDAKKQPLVLGSSFLDSIHEKIDAEDQFDEVIIDTTINDKSLNSNPVAQNDSNNPSSSTSVLRPIGGFALAASVGALAFMGLQNMGVLNGPISQPSNIVDSSGPTAIVQVAPEAQIIGNPVLDGSSSANEYVDADAQTRSMLKRYVDSHMQYSATSTFVPSVRVIAYTDNQ